MDVRLEVHKLKTKAVRRPTIRVEIDNSDKETIQSKDSNKKKKDRKGEDYPLRLVLQRKLSMIKNGTPGSEPGEGAAHR